MRQDLKLGEKLFCLAVNPNKGGLLMSASTSIGITLAGAVFVELFNKELLTIENGLVRLKNPTPQNDEIYEFFLKHIRHHEKGRKLRSWFSWFYARGRKVRGVFIRSLTRKNILRVEEKRFLFIPYQKVFLMDRSLVESIRLELEDFLLGKTEPNDAVVVLSLLVEKTGLLSRVFPERAQRKIAAKNLKKLPETAISKAVQEAIEMMRAAVFVATS
jgi:hypothetical protein